MKYLILSILSLLLLQSCKKYKKPVFPAYVNEGSQDNIYDTVFPGEYLPAWPGSWWRYQTSSGQIKKDTIPAFVVSEVEHLSGSPHHYRYYPRYRGYILSGYYLYNSTQFNPHESSGELLISELIQGAMSEKRRLIQGNYLYNYVLAADSTVNVNGVDYEHVAVINSITPSANPAHVYKREFYAKGIGLIKEEKINYSTGEITNTNTLIDYFVNH